MRMTILFLILGYLSGYTQNGVPKDYFTHPLGIPLAVSGTFGELRSNHFHSGLDLRTEGREGLDVFAAASGEVTRIKISHFGYGKALYVRHPNGYTTVYAHLKKFSPEIEAYVKKRQYVKESYEIELFPKVGTLQVVKGNIIGLSGNTGGSGGPHLHFEIRDGRSRPMNPLNFGINVADSRAPIVNGLWFYSLDQNSHINNEQKKVKLRLIQLEDNNFKTEKITAFGKIGIGVATIDQQNLSNNKNGVYSISTSVNGSENFELKMNRFSFGETRYINRLIDYSHYKSNRNRITKLFIEKNNPLSIYKNKVDNGVITIEDSLSYQIKVLIKDQQNNTTSIDIPIDGKFAKEIQKDSIIKTPHLAKSTENYVFNSNGFDMYIPKGALYENTYLDIAVSGDTVKIHNEQTPLHKNMTLVFDIANYKEEDKSKLFIGRINHKNEPYYSKTSRKGNKLSTRTRTFGKYSLFSDTEGPTIVPINVSEKKWMSKASYLKIKINDELTGVQRYRVTINGKFILMEYDYKTGMLVYDFNDNIITETENKFKLIVLDKVGNSTTFKTTFFRKP